MDETLTVPSPRGFQDRRTGLMVFGILLIILVHCHGSKLG
jgi:hypothetical protein